MFGIDLIGLMVYQLNTAECIKEILPLIQVVEGQNTAHQTRCAFILILNSIDT